MAIYRLIADFTFDALSKEDAFVELSNHFNDITEGEEGINIDGKFKVVLNKGKNKFK